MMFPGYTMMGSWWFIFPAIGGVILIVFLVLLFRAVSPGPPRQGLMSDTPLEILQKRCARGEITKKEYEAVKKDLA